GPSDRMSDDLPRLAVIADVNVERTGGGALLLHRLLRGYPPDRLLVVYNPGLAGAVPESLLAGVAYRPFPYRVPRLIRDRLHAFWPVMMSVYLRRHARALTGLVAGFRPEAVLTVPHWFLWFTAAAVARRLAVPLHLIVHDDWPSYITFRRAGALWNMSRRG